MAGKLCLCLGLAFFYVADARRLRRTGDIIRVTTIKEPPYVSLKDPNGSGNDNYEGYIPDLMRKVAKRADIQYEFHLVADGKYGSNEGNSWNGMIGELTNNRADLAAAPITISEERRAVVDFTPIMNMGTTILVKKPASGEPAIQNAQELSDQTDVQYGVVRDGVTMNWFKTSNNPIYRKMWEFMNADPSLLMDSNEAGVNKVLNSNGEFAFIMENATAAYWTNEKPCELMTVGGNMADQHNQYALAVKKGNDLKASLDSAINALKNEGELRRLEKKWWPKQGCNSAPLSQAAVVTVLSVSILSRFLF